MPLDRCAATKEVAETVAATASKFNKHSYYHLNCTALKNKHQKERRGWGVGRTNLTLVKQPIYLGFEKPHIIFFFSWDLRENEIPPHPTPYPPSPIHPHPFLFCRWVGCLNTTTTLQCNYLLPGNELADSKRIQREWECPTITPFSTVLRLHPACYYTSLLRRQFCA